jgi:hypothetical protein
MNFLTKNLKNINIYYYNFKIIQNNQIDLI